MRLVQYVMLCVDNDRDACHEKAKVFLVACRDGCYVKLRYQGNLAER